MIEIQYSQGTYYTETETMHRWFAIEDGQRIGELYVDIDREIIMNISVIPARRGEGIARSLYEAADAQLDDLKHAPAAGLQHDEIGCGPGFEFEQHHGFL